MQVHERERRESTRGVIAGRREVSYVQLALDLRRSQIFKLEAFAARRTATLEQVGALQFCQREAIRTHKQATVDCYVVCYVVQHANELRHSKSDQAWESDEWTKMERSGGNICSG